MLDNAPNQPSKFTTKNWVEANDDARGAYNTNSQIKFKTSSLCNYSDTHIIAKGTISITAQEGDNINNRDKEAVFKNCAPFTGCISEINSIQIDNAKDMDVVM